MIDAEIVYLTTFRDLVSKALQDDGAVTNKDREQIKTAMNKRFPTWRTSGGFAKRDVLLERNIDWTLRGWRVSGSENSNPGEFSTPNQ
jgi:hypothetical protein